MVCFWGPVIPNLGRYDWMSIGQSINKKNLTPIRPPSSGAIIATDLQRRLLGRKPGKAGVQGSSPVRKAWKPKHPVLNGWKCWFPTISQVKVWFIIQLIANHIIKICHPVFFLPLRGGWKSEPPLNQLNNDSLGFCWSTHFSRMEVDGSDDSKTLPTDLRFAYP